MLFSFNICLSEKDYYEYNKFHLIKSHYGKRLLKLVRVPTVSIIMLMSVISLIANKFSADAFLNLIPALIILIAFVFGGPYIVLALLKLYIKIMKKGGKLPFTPSSVIEFYEDKFVERSKEITLENQYGAIEKINIIDNKIVYIHINSMLAYLLPMKSFESNEEYQRFIEFMKTKTENIEVFS